MRCERNTVLDVATCPLSSRPSGPGLVDPAPVSGFEELSSVDYPDHLACVLFLQGCNWKCPYCHNTALQAGEVRRQGTIAWREVIERLLDRHGLVDAVVFSGGEPTIHSGLIDAVAEVKSYGFKVGLHTNGSRPYMLKKLLDRRLLDWVGLDLKAPRSKYRAAAGVRDTHGEPWISLRMLVDTGIDFQARTTVYRPLLTDDDIICLAQDAARAGAHDLKLQPWRDTRQEGKFQFVENLDALQTTIDLIMDETLHSPGSRFVRQTKGFGPIRHPLLHVSPVPA